MSYSAAIGSCCREPGADLLILSPLLPPQWDVHLHPHHLPRGGPGRILCVSAPPPFQFPSQPFCPSRSSSQATSDLSAPVQRPGSSHAGRSSLPVVLQPAGPLHQHVRRGRERESERTAAADIASPSSTPPPFLTHRPLPPLTPCVCVCVCAQFSQASAVRSYTKFVMGVSRARLAAFLLCSAVVPPPPLSLLSSPPHQIAVSVLTYPFILAADVTAVNNCG